ncbi:MAG TPA: adenylate/guanylate cyclase domain-containing protein [Acidimicrobiia bacterium]|nr:adenylate/guanylate cyclase domain-containing protein [Acidimicrobiia bacterium]
MTTDLPTGTVTFLFTDLEGSSRLWEEHPEAMQVALARHDEIVRGSIERHGGHVVKMRGDGAHAAFATADRAIVAAIAAQQALEHEQWGATGPLQVRVGVHTGAATLREADYFGPAVNRAARLMDVAHGGQIVCSQATADLVRDGLPEGVRLVDLGEHRLRDLSRAERIFGVSAPALRAEFGPLRSLDAFPGNLPLQVSSFIGRDVEIEETVAALGEARVVTLTGVGGVGKTRLALQVAAEVLPQFAEGAWLVELAAVRDPAGVVDAVLAVFGVTERSGQTRTEALVEFLGTKRLLLVVDNCEHVLDPVAELVDAIIRSCPGAAILATSREGLAIVGERILAVPSLGTPAVDAGLGVIAGSDAVQLFVDRAHAADSTFALNAENAGAVVQVCRRLDGVPLAIELASARVSMMSPAELAAALDQRFEVLAGGRRGAVKRQQTLRATIDWSYDLLDEAHQRLLARLAVFAGGWTREAAEAVCAGDPIGTRAIFALLGDLVARSLVVADRGQPDTRYRLSETIREYAEERLAEHHETKSLRDRHARWYIEYVKRCRELLWGPDQIISGKRILADGDNVLAAFGHAVDSGDLDLATAFIDHAVEPAQVGFALRLPVAPVLAMPGIESHRSYPVVLMAAASEARAAGEADRSDELGAAALAAEAAQTTPPPYSSDLTYMAHTLAGGNWMTRGEWSKGAAASLEGVAYSREAGLGAYTPVEMGGAAMMLCLGGRPADAVPIATEGLALARATGMPTAIAMNLVALALALTRETPERARALLQEAFELNATLDYEHFTELAQMTIAAASLADWPLTARLARRSIRHLHWINDRIQLAGILNIAARALCDTDPDAAATIQGTVRTLASAIPSPAETPSTPSGSMFIDFRRETTRHLTQHLGAERLRELRDHGTTMDTDHAVAYTLAHLDQYLAHTGH